MPRVACSRRVNGQNRTMARRPSRQRVYDHRLRKLVWETGNPDLFPDLAIPRSTLAGWLREPPPEVVTVDWLAHSDVSLILTLHKTEKRNVILLALLRLLLTLVRVRGCHLDGQRLRMGAPRRRSWPRSSRRGRHCRSRQYWLFYTCRRHVTAREVGQR